MTKQQRKEMEIMLDTHGCIENNIDISSLNVKDYINNFDPNKKTSGAKVVSFHQELSVQ